MLVNACLSIVYVLLGSFRGLLNFKGVMLLVRCNYSISIEGLFLTSHYIVTTGMAEYIIYFATVLGVLVLRHSSSPGMPKTALAHYSTSIFNPLIFCSVSILVVARSAIAHPMQIVAIFAFFGCGYLIYRSHWWWRFVRKADVQAPYELHTLT